MSTGTGEGETLVTFQSKSQRDPLYMLEVAQPGNFLLVIVLKLALTTIDKSADQT